MIGGIRKRQLKRKLNQPSTTMSSSTPNNNFTTNQIIEFDFTSHLRPTSPTNCFIETKNYSKDDSFSTDMLSEMNVHKTNKIFNPLALTNNNQVSDENQNICNGVMLMKEMNDNQYSSQCVKQQINTDNTCDMNVTDKCTEINLPFSDKKITKIKTYH